MEFEMSTAISPGKPTPREQDRPHREATRIPAESVSGREASAPEKIAAATAQTAWKATAMNQALSKVRAAAEIGHAKQLWRSRANQVAVPATVRFLALMLAPRDSTVSLHLRIVMGTRTVIPSLVRAPR